MRCSWTYGQRVLRAAKHTATDSLTTKHNRGIAEAPPVEPLLSGLMTEFAGALLED